MLSYFIISDNYIQKAKKNYIDSRVRRNLNSLNNELQDVQRIMVQNIDDVLQRGTVLSGTILFYCIKSHRFKQLYVYANNKLKFFLKIKYFFY